MIELKLNNSLFKLIIFKYDSIATKYHCIGNLGSIKVLNQEFRIAI